MSARERQAQDEALARMLQLEERGPQRVRPTDQDILSQSQAATLLENSRRILSQDRHRRLSSQELRDLELARQFERFAVFSGSQIRERPTSNSIVEQNERDITVTGRNVHNRGSTQRSEGERMVSTSVLSELRGIESAIRDQTSHTTPSGLSQGLTMERRHSEQRELHIGGKRDGVRYLGGSFAGGDSSIHGIMSDASACTPHPRAPGELNNTDSRLNRDHASWDLLSKSRTPGSEEKHKRSLSVDEPSAFARTSLDKNLLGIPQSEMATPASTKNAVTTDLEIARQMQDLEDQGLGRLNSERKFLSRENSADSDSDDSDSERGGFALPLTMMGRPAPKATRSSQEEEDAKLARFMEESGASIRDLSDDQVNCLLESNQASGGLSSKRRVPTNGDAHTKTIPNEMYNNLGNSSSAAAPTDAQPRHFTQPIPSTSVRSHGDRSHQDQTVKLPGLNPLSEDVFLDIPLKERKKKKGWFAGRTDKKSAVTSPVIHSASAGSLRGSVPSAIPPPPGGSLSIPPPSSPRRVAVVSHPLSPAPTAFSRSAVLSSPVPSSQPLGIPTPMSGRNAGPRPTVGRSWAPVSPRKGSIRVDTTNPPPESSGPVALRPSPLPHSVSVSRNLAQTAQSQISGPSSRPPTRGSAMCATCRQSGGSFVAALDKKYHIECFRCLYCNERIDSTAPFSFSQNDQGEKHPYHRKCYAELYNVKCAVCSDNIPANSDGTVTFVKHPFFDAEQMCLRHAETPGRRCTGCHRFEPLRAPFADLNDGDRCVCYSCCRTVVVDNADVSPLWERVMDFFEHHLKLPVWKEMRDIPILVVQSDALSDQLQRSDNSAHKGASQIMARGLCLTDHDPNRRFKLPSMRFINSTRSFEAIEDHGFTYFEVPPTGGRGNPNSHVFAILCLSGLPRDLTTSVLAHEATHAWIKMHPQYEPRKPLPAQVEEGCAQLVAMLLLTDGLGGDPPNPISDGGGACDDGPSDEKLRQYFKFSIERDHDDIYGEGYRKAARAYRDIGIEALLSHVVRYRTFPTT